jgi:hypothetical protein
VPKEKWIDPTKQYKTRSGKRVISIDILLKNSIGEEVTFPVKGVVVLSEKPYRSSYQIWTLDGRASIFKDHKDDLVEQKG